MAKYFHQRDFLHRFRLLPDPGDLLPLHQGEVRGALLPDPGDVLPRRQTVGEVRGALLPDPGDVLPRHQASLLRDNLFHRRDPLLTLFLGELLAGICLKSLCRASPDHFIWETAGPRLCRRRRLLPPAPRPRISCSSCILTLAIHWIYGHI